MKLFVIFFVTFILTIVNISASELPAVEKLKNTGSLENFVRKSRQIFEDINLDVIRENQGKS